MSGPKGKPTDKVKNRKGERTVKDPTTGLDVTIKDADFKGISSTILCKVNSPYLQIFLVLMITLELRKRLLLVAQPRLHRQHPVLPAQEIFLCNHIYQHQRPRFPRF